MQHQQTNAFDQTPAGLIAADTAARFFGTSQTTDELTTKQKVALLQYAAGRGHEEFLDTLISLLPAELRMAASDAYDASFG